MENTEPNITEDFTKEYAQDSWGLNKKLEPLLEESQNVLRKSRDIKDRIYGFYI